MQKELPDDIRLYRFISFEEFISLLTKKQEHYCRPSVWEDTYEGYLYSVMTQSEKRKQIVCKLLDGQDEQLEHALEAARKYSIIWLAKTFQYGKCWTTLEESDALWRIYSFNNHAIRISTTIDKIKRTLPPNIYSVPHFRKVEYDIMDKDIFEKQMLQIFSMDNAAEPYYHKRPAFEHEAEVRVIVSTREYWELHQMNEKFTALNLLRYKTELQDRDKRIETLCKCLEDFTEKFEGTKEADHLDVDISGVDDYIDSVMVHPFAHNWFVDLVDAVCKEHSITFLSKSRLYDPVV